MPKKPILLLTCLCCFAASYGQVACPQPSDFSFSIDPCNPLSVQFATSASSYTAILWQMGDGAIVPGASNPTHSYTAPGTYPVKMTVTQPGCVDIISKNITIGASPAHIIQTPDTVICAGGSKQLRASPAPKFCWSPTTWLDNPNSSSPISKPAGNITYYYTAEITGGNLIPNGDFSQGNTGFGSDYVYQTTNTVLTGAYGVNSSAYAWNVGASDCRDHTTGNGNMLLANGATVPGKRVWYVTLNVTQNTNYSFSAWIQSISKAAFSTLRFTINNNYLGNPILAPTTNCVWQRFDAFWNSGSNTTALIALEDFTYDSDGNDFALDDISFAPLFVQRDSVTISVEKPAITITRDTTICAGSSLQLHATGAATYLWTPSIALSNATISNPVASPAGSIKYVVTGTSSHGCSVSDSVKVTVERAVVAVNRDTMICSGSSVQLQANGAATYLWTPSTALSNATISNPVASPAVSTKYIVTGTSTHGCTAKDSVTISVEKPAITVTPDTSVCSGSRVQLQANGAVSYVWTPSSGLSGATISNPVASPSVSTKYLVTGTNAHGCVAKDSVTITARPVPLVNISRDTTICHNTTVRLSASGGGRYLWQPAGSLDNPASATPVAAPVANTLYRVTVTGSNNCSSADSVMVSVIPQPVFSVSGSQPACAGTPVQLKASGGDTYSWNPATGLDNPSINNPMANPANTTTYTVKMTRQTCSDSASLSTTLTVLPTPAVSAVKSNDINCTTPAAQLTATGAETYTWTPATGLNNSTIANPLASPDSTVTYIVQGRAANGCYGYDSLLVTVNNVGKIIFDLPNAFTPNNDGNNDCFGLKRYAGQLRSLEFSIYNRFGQMVFHSTNPAACWDGRFGGKLQDPGGFVYIIKGSSLCGTFFRKGVVMLVR